MRLRVTLHQDGSYRVEKRGLFFWRELDFEDFVCVPGLPHELDFGYGLDKWSTMSRAEEAARAYAKWLTKPASVPVLDVKEPTRHVR